MNDGIILNPGTGGSTVATDDIGGTHYQIVKVAFGAPDSATPVSPSDPLPVAASTLPLPVGAATAANQTAGNTSLTAIANALAGTLGINGSVVVSNFPATQAISAASLPLPTGAATAAAQATGNTTLASILTALGTPLQAGGSVSISGTVAVSGPLTDAQLRATAVPISAASLPLPTGAATAAAQATGNTSLANLDADVGNVSDAAAAADGTGNYSLIAAAKRALLNWASLLGRIPASLGQATMVNSFPVAIASNQSAVPVSGTVGVAGAVNVSPDNVLDSLTTSGSVTSATTIVSVPTAGFQGGSFQVTSAGSATIAYEQSNDGLVWIALPVVNVAAVSNSVVTVSTTTGAYAFTSALAFVRARVSAYTSGNVAVTLTQKRTVAPVTGISLASSTQTIGAIAGGGNSIGNLTRANPFTDSSTALGANGTFTGTGRATTGANYSKFNGVAWADQAGTLFIDQSLDTGATYQTISSQALTANAAAVLSVPVTGAAGTATLYRVRYVNGAVAQGTFRISSSFTAA